MIFAFYKEALQIIKNNKLFILLYLFTYLSSIPRSEGANFSLWSICGFWPVTLFLTLYLELYAIRMVFEYRKTTDQTDLPSNLPQKYFWKSLLVGIVSLAWIYIILGLPYVLIGVILDLSSGMILWGVNFIWCFVLGFMIFGLYNLGVIILVTTNSLPLKSPTLGLIEVYRNFYYYFKVYLSTVVISYTPIVIAAFYSVLWNSFGFLFPNSSFSFNPNQSAYGLLFNSNAKLVFFFIFMGMYMVQKIVMTLSYFDRPELVDSKIIKNVSI